MVASGAGQSAPRANLIEVRVPRLESLYETLDPSPFREKALDPDFEAYLLDCAGEFGDALPLTVLVHAPPELRDHAADLATALHAHFGFLLQQHARRERTQARRHRAVVFAGLGVLAGALVLRRLLQGWSGSGGEILAEGLLLLGWVALWRPIDALLFDRHATREERGVLSRLAEARVEWRDAERGPGR